jgi:hypothetical protein
VVVEVETADMIVDVMWWGFVKCSSRF